GAMVERYRAAHDAWVAGKIIAPARVTQHQQAGVAVCGCEGASPLGRHSQHLEEISGGVDSQHHARRAMPAQGALSKDPGLAGDGIEAASLALEGSQVAIRDKDA